MAETHELRLKINAAAARAGSREFIGALNAIKTAVRTLDRDSEGAFTRIRNNSKTLGVGVRGLAESYNVARAANNKFATALGKTNAALARQMSLAKQARGALSTPSTATTSVSRGGGGEQQIASQNRIKRSVDDTRLSVERLTTSLMKVSGFQSINDLGLAFSRFKKEVSGAAVTTQQFDNAKTKLNSSLKGAQTSLVTLTAKAQENARAEREAAAAVRQKDSANRAEAASAKAAASATKAQTAATQKQANVQLSAAQAIRQAEQETARLSNRLNAIGDARGVHAINAALIQLRANAAGGVATTTQLRQAMAQFADAASRAKVSLINVDGVQQKTARSAKLLSLSEREAANNARLVEREMRSIAGASNAASKAMRNATGSMRGLENAFSATFQAGTAFRTLLGSITVGTFTRSVFQAGAALQQFQIAMQVATGSMQGASQQMDFIDGLSRNLGISLRGAREDFGKFAVSASLAGVEAQTAQEIFQSVSEALTVMGRGAEDQKLSFLALEQMLSKNTISSEELRRQLGERLPGAVNLMAKAVGVSTQELQKMLKAGSLVSSEVLPKFAKEVKKAFGPGLEQALTKAPAALGRFRSELELALQAVSQSGFMDQVADGLNQLTQSLRSPEAKRAMQQLGAGLADLSAIAFNMAQVVIENIDRIAVVTKAVIGGLVVRQVMLMANAIITGTARAALGFSTLVAGMTGTTAAAAAQTTAFAEVTAAETALTIATVKQTAATDLQIASQLRANGVFGAAPAILAKQTGALAATGAAAGRLSVAMTGASRTMGLLAGPAGLILTGLLVLPALFGDIGDSSSKMADEIDAAVRRAGVSFDSMGMAAARASSSVELSRMLGDIDTLGNAVETFTRDSTADIEALGDALQILGTKTPTDLIVGTKLTEGVQTLESLKSVFGETALQMDQFSRGTKSTIRDLTEMTQEALSSGKGFLLLRDNIHEAIASNPAAGKVLASLAKMTEELALAELALVSNREKLVALYGSADDRLVKTFADSAQAVVRTGQGLDELRSEMERLAKDSESAAPALRKVFEEVESAFATGRGVGSFRTRVLAIFDDSIIKLEKLRAASVSAEEAAGKAGVSFAKKVTETLSGLGDIGAFNPFVGGIETGVLEDIKEISDEFRRFEDFEVSFDRLSSVIGSMTFPTETAQAFATAMLNQFEALPAAEQTYTSLNSILEELGPAFPESEVLAFEDALRKTIRTGQDASLSAADYVRQLVILRDSMDNVDAKALVQGLIDSARALNDEEIAAIAAARGLDAAARAAHNAGAAAAAGANGVLTMAQAFATLAQASAGIGATLSGALAASNEKLRIEGLAGSERAVAEYFASYGEGGKIVAKTNAQIADLETKLSTATGPGRVELNAQLDSLKGQLGSFQVAQTAIQTKLFDARNAGKGGGGGGGGGGRTADLKSEKQALEDLQSAFSDRIQSLDTENAALAMLSSGMTTSAEAAQMLAEAQANGVVLTDEQTRSFFEQIEATEKLNESLKRLANDPVNDWMKSVPTWREAGQQIEVGVFESLSDTISNFIKTGEFSFEALGESILGIVADIIADKAVKELATLFGGNTTGTGEGGFGLGGILSGLFPNGGSMGDDPDPFASGFGGGNGVEMQQAIATGGTQAAETMRQAIIQAGQQVGSSITQSGSQAGASMGASVTSSGATAGASMSTSVTTSSSTGAATMGTAIKTASAAGAPQLAQGVVNGSKQGGGFFQQLFGNLFKGAGGGGGGGGGGLAGIFGMILPALFGSGGGVTSGSGPSIPQVMAPAAAFRQAPSFAMGTGNTSGGIPAVLHDNEAVVPLTGGRRIPVDMGEDARGGGSKTVVQNFNITTPDADSFRKSQKQIAADAASSGRRAMTENG